MGFRFGPYIPVAQRKAGARRELAALAKRTGVAPSPVVIEGRQIARTFWGQAWCDNLERYSDFATRLPRGRTYARNGSVVDLRVEPGRVEARVAGSELYTVEIAIRALAPARWKAVKKACTGKISSLVALLRGELSAEVLEVLTRSGGLFPEPGEIAMRCSCPDVASLCKHLAATLYGVGARLDGRPELFFVLRKVDQAELISEAAGSAAPVAKGGRGKKKIAKAKLSSVFGIELDE
jgi:uncharacterized Zn finger protein